MIRCYIVTLIFCYSPPALAQTSPRPDSIQATQAGTINISGDTEMDPADAFPLSPVDENEVHFWSDPMPEFPGDLKAYIKKNLVLPKAVRQGKVKGRVKIRFHVNKDSSISDIKIIDSLGGGCDEEAIKLVKNMPPWKPGMKDGKVVIVNEMLTIYFGKD